MAHWSGRRQILRTLPKVFALVCITGFCVTAQNPKSTPPNIDNGVVKLPVIEKQDIRFQRVITSEGMSELRATTMLEDDQGFIWLGTQHGLNRYDGYEFKLFKHDPARPDSLSGVIILSLFKDRSGRLWIASDQSLDRFDPSTEKFVHYPFNAEGELAVAAMDISEDRTGKLWLATEKGLYRLDPATGSIVRYRHDANDPSSLASNFIRQSGEDKAGRFWVLTPEGLDRFDRDTGKVTLRVPWRDGTNSSFYEDRAGIFWLTGSSNGLATYNSETNELTRYSLHDQGTRSARSGVYSVLEDRAGNIWVGTLNEGLFKLDRERRGFIRYRRHPDNPDGLASDQVRTLLEDREGNIWVGFQEVGFSIFANREPAFETLWKASDNPQGYGTLISNMFQDRDGVLWLSTVPALIAIDRKTGKRSSYRSAGPKFPTDATGIAEDTAGRLWIGTYGRGILRFDRKTGKFQPLRNSPPDASVVFQLFTDHESRIWAVTWNDIKLLDPEKESLTGYLSRPENRAVPPADSHALNGIRPLAMREDREGVFWIGTAYTGLVRFDPKHGQFAVYPSHPNDPTSLSNARVNAPFADSSGTVWGGTQNGLNRLDLKTGKFTSYYERDGLGGNVVGCILEDRRGDLWMSTNKGISRFDPQLKIFRNYSVIDGLPGADMTGAGACYKSPSGEMFFGGFSGATAFHPDKVVESPYVPPVVLTEFRLFGKSVEAGADSVLKESVTHATALTLPHDQNSFSLEFSALGYLNASTNRYRYKLESLESEWNEVSSKERLVTYPATPPGSYIFRVQVASARGGWNEPGMKLQIQILPPWWATWWFRAISGLTIAAIILAAFRARVQGLKMAAIRLEAEVTQRTHELAIAKGAAETAKEAAERASKAKSTFLATMSHELRTPLNAILGFSALVRDNPDLREEHRTSLEIVNRSGEHLLGLIDDVLDTAKIEAGHVALDERDFDVISLVRDNIHMMSARARDKGLALSLETSSAVPQFVRSDPGKLRQVLINLIGNALKFTERGGVTVRLDAKQPDGNQRTVLTMEVEDTGTGIAPEDQNRIFEVFVQAGDTSAQKGTGLGLSITRQFVQLMGGTIRVHSALGKGSRFSVQLPVEKVDQPDLGLDRDHRQVVRLAPGEPEYRILVVEDKEENWLLLQRLLLNAGFQVEVAENGRQAIERFQAWQPHLIWMDVRLPVMGGVEATRQIRLCEGGQNVKIVALSASAFSQERDSVLAAGVDDFLGKPFRREEIFDCMSRHLGVRYSYRLVERGHEPDPVSVPRPDLSTLPEQIRKELADAVVSLDSEHIRKLISRVADHDAKLGETLSASAKRLAYTEILRALDDCNSRVGEKTL